MMRLALLAAVAVVAGAHDATAAVAAAKAAMGEVSWAEARCSGPRVDRQCRLLARLRAPRRARIAAKPSDQTSESGNSSKSIYLLPQCKVVQCLGLRARLVRNLG